MQDLSMPNHVTSSDNSITSHRVNFNPSDYSTIIFDFDGVIAPAGRLFPENFDYSEQAILSHPGIQHELLQHVAYGLIGIDFTLQQVNQIYHNDKLYGGSYWDLIESGLHNVRKLDSTTTRLLLPNFIEAYNYVASQFEQKAPISERACLSDQQKISLDLLYKLPLFAYESFFNFLQTWRNSATNSQVAVYTASPLSYVSAMIKHMHLPEFVLVQGCDALWTKKGKDKSWPLALLDILQHMNATSNNTLVIDDNLSLLKAAVATSCKGIVFAGKKEKIPALKQLANDTSNLYVTESPHNLSSIILP